jgi:hypothetical protein
MNFLKYNFLPVLGILVLFIFLGLSYATGNLLFNKLVICSFIFSIIFLLRIDVKYENMEDKNTNIPKLQIIRNERKV